MDCSSLMIFFFYLLICLILLKIYNDITKGKFESDKRLDGQVIIVTGASSGIGKYTALDLAKRGAKVIIAGVDLKQSNEAKAEIVKISGNKNIVVKHLDLASFKSVRNFAKEILESESRLDVLVNNAGVSCAVNPITEDGLPMGLQVNHYGPFLLTNLLIGLLKKSSPSRIIHVSSVLHLLGEINLDNLNVVSSMRFMPVYSNSKLFNFVGSNEVARRLKGSGVTSNALHPGACNTDIMNNFSYIRKIYIKISFRFFFKNAEQGAQTSMYLAVSDEVANVSGKFFADCKESWWSRPIANDKEIGKKFFEKCCEIVGLKPEERLL